MKIWLTCALTLCSAATNAITNIERERLGDHAQGTRGHVSVTLDGREANSDKIALGSELKLHHHTLQHEWLMLASRDYAEVDDEVNTDKTFAHLRFVKKQSSKWAYETFAQHEDDEFRSLSSRALLGAGIRHTIPSKNEHELNRFGVGFFLEDEDYLHEGDKNDEQTVRLNLYWAYKNRLNDHASYSSTFYFQPSVEDMNDQKGLWQNAITASVTETISLSVKWDVVHDTRTPDEVVATETTYKTVLIYNF